MPLVIPAPLPGETYDAYVDRLHALGVVGTITEHVLADDSYDPDLGPDALVRTNPATGTRVLPGTDVGVIVNPPTAPPVGATGSLRPAPGPDDRCGPVVPDVSLEPLAALPLGDHFPFGIFDWIADTLGGWGGGGEAPKFTVPMPGDIDDLEIDLAIGDGAMAYVRPTILVISVLGLMWLLASSAAGFTRLGGSD